MSFGQAIANATELALRYAELLNKDIPADKFSHMPTKDFNSPAFCMGHLSIYPVRMLTLLGREDLIVPNPPGWEDMFKAGAPCVDVAGKYPGKDAILDHWTKGYTATITALKATPDSIFAEPNPGEGRMKEMFPTKGGLLVFVCAGHPQSHLGQISMWRRIMGLGSAM